MSSEGNTKPIARHELGAWLDGEIAWAVDDFLPVPRYESEPSNPDARERSRLLQLLGSINYSILKRNRVYFEVEGVVYKTLWGLYWRSVFTGVEHYLLRCQQISGDIW